MDITTCVSRKVNELSNLITWKVTQITLSRVLTCRSVLNIIYTCYCDVGYEDKVNV